MLLHACGWHAELIDEACSALSEACSEGELEGRDVLDLTPEEVQGVLAQPIVKDEIRALCRVAEVHDRADPEGDQVRGALHDLDAFADSLGEG